MKNDIKHYIPFFFLVFLCRVAFPQQFFIKTYTIENGLPTRNINDACQDEEGYMWFATNYGISKYDGFKFENYDTKNGLPNHIYIKIVLDEKGILWALPRRKLDTIIYLKNNTWNKINPPEAKPSQNFLINTFDVIYKNNQPVICIGSYDGFHICENGKWTHFAISDKQAQNYVYTVVANKQKFYLSTKIGICVFDGKKTDWSLNNLIKPYGLDIIAINFENRNTPDEKMWVLSEKRLGYIQHGSFKLVTDKFQLPHPLIYYYSYLNSDKSGNVFFGNIWAKYYIPAGSGLPVPMMFENGFSSNGATSVFIDREQNIWFTDTRGINKINNLRIINYFKKNGMLEDEVTAIAEMKTGGIVLGHNNGLSVLKNNKFRVIEFPDLKFSTRRVADMMKDKQGNIWFVSISKGVGRLQDDGKLSWLSSDKFPVFNAIQQDRTGRIWLGADTTLFYMKNGNLIEFLPFNRRHSTIRKIFKCDNHGIYIAGSNGLWHVQDDKVERIPSPPDRKADNVFAYFKSKRGEEFVGTMNGLYKIKNGRIEKFKSKDIEINNPVFFIFQDADENYWIGSNIGVYKWDGKSKLEVFNIYNGLAGWETNRAAGMADSKGRLWIGTDRGLTCFEPGYDRTAIATPEVKLLFAEDSKGIQYPLTNSCEINYSDNTLAFHFRAMSFVNENLIEYRYKLEGYDQEWQHVNQAMLGNVKYIGLKPGKYTLYVMARNFSGRWSPVSRSEIIRIKSPVYLTWWFILIALILISVIIFGIIRIRVQKVHNSLLRKEIIERKRIEQDLTESKQKYRDIVDLLLETIFEADFSGRLVFMNNTGLKLFGYSNSDPDSYILIDQLVSPESRDDIHRHMEAVYGFKKPERILITGMTKTGSTFPMSLHTVPILLKGKCTGTRGIIIDMTEQKKHEEQLKKYAEVLLASNNSKDKLFSIIAHDLRSPFTTFLGFTELLDEEINTLSETELKNILTLMKGSARNLYQLLENLLEWAMLHREITRFEQKITLLTPLVENCLGIISDSARQKEIEITIDIPSNIRVNADIHMLMSIFRNLLTNAIKFTPRGGKVAISASENAEHFVIIAVKDTGIGINKEMINQIFQIGTSIKTKGTEGELSTGLGLILCKEFVEKHGGEIWVTSAEGEGSTFYFTIKSTTT